ncbi:MAG: ORF6C domain-containing protein [Lachnospiraceae bacterium]|nr:ORF6C domain-containing protein [Lachnospiraceae bacterium]
MIQLEQKYIDSREVAEMVGKEHAKLLRDIRNYIDQLGQAKIGESEFFSESTYQNSQNKMMPCFRVTKKGCEFIAHKLTGIKGTEFTAKYINRFHEMEEQIRKPRTTIELLEMEFAAIKEVDNKVDAVTKDLQDLKSSLPLLPADADEVKHEVNKKAIACLCGKGSNAYKDRSLCQKVYSDIYRELKRQFDVSQYKYIRRSQKHLAIQIVRDYQMPFVLAEEVTDANAQLNMGDGVDGV